MICSSIMRNSSRGTPGVKKNRALPMSSAKPQAVPTGLSSISEPSGSIACFRLFGDMTRLRRRKKSSMRASHCSLRTRSTLGGACRDLLRQIVDGRPQPTIDDNGLGARPGHLECRQQFLAVVADNRPPRHRQPEILELLAHVVEVGVDDFAGQDFVAGADDLDAHSLASPGWVDGACLSRHVRPLVQGLV